MTSSLGSASAVRGHLVSAAMGVRQVTGASRAADPASVTDMQTSVTREPESASAAGTTPEEINVKGDAGTASWDQLLFNHETLILSIMCYATYTYSFIKPKLTSVFDNELYLISSKGV